MRTGIRVVLVAGAFALLLFAGAFLLFMARLPQRDPERKLTGEYSVFVANASDVTVCRGNSVVVEPLVRSLAVIPEHGLIVGTRVKAKWGDPLEHFVVDTTRHRVFKGMGLGDCEAMLRAKYGVAFPALRDVAEYLKAGDGTASGGNAGEAMNHARHQ